MVSQGKLIFVNGSSSSGKSSACRVLQDMFSEQTLLMGIDLFLQSIPTKQNDLATIDPSYFTAKKYIKNEQQYYDIAIGPLFDKVICTSYQAIAAFLDAGVNIISDQLFWSPKWFQAALKTLISYHVFYVGLFVDDAEGAKRESHRNHGTEGILENARPTGMNRTSAIITHKNMIYDFSIDNTHLSIQETAARIKQAFDSTPNPTAFKSLYQTYQA